MEQISIEFNDNKKDISSEEANILLCASKKLRLVLFFEQNFEYLIKNYLEYESTIAVKSVCQLIKGDESTDELYNHLSDIVVKLLNLFSTARAYVDKSPSIIKKISGSKEIFEMECSHYYDTDFSYRFITELRNYSQHHSDPFSFLRMGRSWREKEDLEFYTNPMIDTETLRINKKFKARILPEISEKFHLTYCIRRYIECLSKIHKKISLVFSDEIKELAEKVNRIIRNKNLRINNDEVIYLYHKEHYEILNLNFNKYYLLNNQHIRLQNISNHCINTCISPAEKDTIKNLDNIKFDSPEESIEYYISIRTNHNDCIVNNINIKTLPEDCRAQVYKLIVE